MSNGEARDPSDTVELRLQAFERLKSVATKADLPQLIDALKSEKSDFWIRELLSEPIAELGGPAQLGDLLVALKKGADEGHDNDGFCFHLTEMAEMHPHACRQELEFLLKDQSCQFREEAAWLLEFCGDSPHNK